MTAKPAASGQTSKHAGTAKHLAHLAHLAHEAHLAHLKHHPAAKSPVAPKTKSVIVKPTAPLGKKKPAKPTMKPKKPTAKKTARGASLYLDALPWCPVESLAASLRLVGKTASFDELIELFWYASDGTWEAVPILSVLEAASRNGLSGAYPVFRETDTLRDGVIIGTTIPAGPHTVTLDGSGVWTWGEWRPLSRPLSIEEAWEVSWQ